LIKKAGPIGNILSAHGTFCPLPLWERVGVRVLKTGFLPYFFPIHGHGGNLFKEEILI
jgi:hypothetical protein